MSHTVSRRSSADRRRGRLVWLVGLVAISFVILLKAWGQTPLERLTPLVFDLYQRLDPRPEAGAPVAVVDIDEASIAELGQWPWSRAIVARLVDRLGEMGVATIAFDVVFSEPDRTSLAQAAADLSNAGVPVDLPPEIAARDNDAILAESFSRNSVTAGFVISDATGGTIAPPKAGFSFGGADPTTYLPPFGGGVVNLPELTQAAQGMGFFSFSRTIDGIVRSIPLVALSQGRLYPSLSVEALRVAQGAGSFVIRSTGASGEIDTGVAAMTALRTGALDVPTGPDGEFWVYFSGLPTMPVVPARAILSDDPSELASAAAGLEGRIVLVGTSAVGLRDLVATPVSSSLPGVLVHAEIIDQIVGQMFLARPDWAEGAETAAGILLGLLLVLVAARAGAIPTTTAAGLLLAASAGLSWYAFSVQRLLIDPILPAAVIAMVFFVTMPLLLLLTDREKQFVRGAFGRYLAPSLVERLADNPNALKLGGEMRDLTILFSDIRGFTTLSEKLDPDELTALLNGFLTPMTDVLLESQATIDKYMGDAIMAFWNAPLDIEAHPRRACLAALAMVERLETLNREREVPLAIGIGLHRGPACVGNLGSIQRFSYSAIGDSVNLASRVEGLTKGYGVSILVTETVQREAADLAYLEVDRVGVVGRAEPITVYALLGDAALATSQAFRDLSDNHDRMLAAYRRVDLDGAAAALQEARATAPGQLAGLYDLYAERIAAFRTDPPPAGWDGVYRATKK